MCHGRNILIETVGTSPTATTTDGGGGARRAAAQDGGGDRGVIRIPTIPSSVCTTKRDECVTDGISSSRQSEQVRRRQLRTAAAARDGRRRKMGAATVSGREGREAATRVLVL
ncbi:hypothetical protein F511_18437 [Dorcoceras hygrometricum]|uniref:Uncharacterized protein n=1 Tax=Dorcoceras hygrometricum TaxID=472368 RepID=A0A2Z7AQ42_9LAMI|nr:hypothetical protein F511_18437 [Dorcoceras hygrometricum]